MDKEMMNALEADGEKMAALTGEDHGPVFVDDELFDTGERATVIKGKGGFLTLDDPVRVLAPKPKP